MSDLPLVAIVGRPNVGKSTLFNRITGQRRAIVGDEPGITRDRIYGAADWFGKQFELVDTGGMLVGDSAEVPAKIVEQAQVAIGQAKQIILVVDGRAELTAADLELARLLRKTGKSITLAINKMESQAALQGASDFYKMGFDKVFPISAEHNLAVDDLLDDVTSEFAESSELSNPAKEIAVAIIGRPNVGKSTLLNQLVGDERSIVSEVPGTTRDAVDTVVEKSGVRYRLVDTAGIRRHGRTKQMAEKLSVVMARRHIRMCDTALLLIDAIEGITALDATIAGYAFEEGKSLILFMNKWDLVEKRRERERTLDDQARMKLKFLDFVPRLFISGKTRIGIGKVFPEIRKISEARTKRIPTSELNKFLRSIDMDRATSPVSKKPKIYYMTQASASPPRFILFTDKKGALHFSFERFLVNQIRKQYGFPGSPIIIQQRPHHK